MNQLLLAANSEKNLLMTEPTYISINQIFHSNYKPTTTSPNQPPYRTPNSNPSSPIPQLKLLNSNNNNNDNNINDQYLYINSLNQRQSFSTENLYSNNNNNLNPLHHQLPLQQQQQHPNFNSLIPLQKNKNNFDSISQKSSSPLQYFTNNNVNKNSILDENKRQDLKDNNNNNQIYYPLPHQLQNSSSLQLQNSSSLQQHSSQQQQQQRSNPESPELVLDKILYACDTMKKVVLANKAILTQSPNSIIPHEKLRKVYSKVYETYQLLCEISFTSAEPQSNYSPQHQLQQQQRQQNNEVINKDIEFIRNKRALVTNNPQKSKKRIRSAPGPGVCHSCHTKETPEWRRGPDGARTLCNACGLHFAKLRKKLSKNNAVETTPSNQSNSSPSINLNVNSPEYSNNSISGEEEELQQQLQQKEEQHQRQQQKEEQHQRYQQKEELQQQQKEEQRMEKEQQQLQKEEHLLPKEEHHQQNHSFKPNNTSILSSATSLPPPILPSSPISSNSQIQSNPTFITNASNSIENIKDSLSTTSSN
ncbi:hypothetical protein HDU92_008253 [Lobulomyces angularis]|nr:hypothetical protein HDU92_008253 [Lobulomyces angularis]